MRDASLLAMTNGQCNKALAKFSGLPLLDYKEQPYTAAVERIIPEILDYNAQHHVFLCHPEFLERVQLKPKKESQFRELIRFSYNTSTPADASNESSPEAKTVEASLAEFGKVISRSNCNIMLNAPAGHGKSHMIKNVMRPLLEKRYGKHGVWFTASTGIAAIGLGEGAGTLHSMVGIGKAAGTADDVFKNMPDRAKKRFRKVKVSTFILSFLIPCCQSNATSNARKQWLYAVMNNA